jgi:hypothetical protein
MAENKSVAPPTSAVPDPYKTSPYKRQASEVPLANLKHGRITNRQRPIS